MCVCVCVCVCVLEENVRETVICYISEHSSRDPLSRHIEREINVLFVLCYLPNLFL